MAHNLGLEVIAEGVETAAQAAFLLDEKCEEAQGYFYSEPLPAEEFEAYLRDKRSPAEPNLGRDEPDPKFAFRRRASGRRSA